MARILGVDPGNLGGFAIYDTSRRAITETHAMPVIKNGAKIVSLDRAGLLSLTTGFGYLDLALLEVVGARSYTNAKGERRLEAGMFQFGRGYGFVEALLYVKGCALEFVTPQVWKKALKCPAEKDLAVARADQLLPDSRSEWRGPRGGLRDGIAEAAMIAYYGAEYVLRGDGPAAPAPAKTRARKAKVGIEEEILEDFDERIEIDAFLE
jgi:crossover junction endodeoxyribonuclease RuvC